LLAPGEQLWIDVGDLKQRQIPDAKGKVIPLSAVTGTYQIEDMNDPDVGWLFEGKLTIDKTFGHAAYGCAVCCGDDYAWLDPDPLYTAVGSGAQDEIWGSNACFGTEHDRTGISYGWTSSNHAVATMGPGKGWVNGIAAGTSSITGYFDSRQDDGSGRCVLQPLDGGGTGNVKPTISGPNTVWWFNGSASANYPTSVALTSNAGASTIWSVTAGANRVSLSTTHGAQTTVSSSRQYFSAMVGDISIIATANNQPSDPFKMTARTPWKLVFDALDSSTSPSSTNGYSTLLQYDIHDQFDSAMTSDVFWNESVGVLQNANGSNWATCCGGISTGGGTAPKLIDLLEPPQLALHPSPTPTFTSSQGSGTTVYRTAPQSIYIGSSTSGAGRFVQSDTLTWYIDHGAHTQIVIPPLPPE
jgi:hypothetical protein